MHLMKVHVLLLILLKSATSSEELNSLVQEKIVNAHNDLRSKIALGSFTAKEQSVPPASNMLKMEWSEELAKSSEEFAMECSDTHGDHPGVGENLYVEWNSELSDVDVYVDSALHFWENEFQENGFPSNIYSKDTKKLGIGHATQMVWAKSDKIGCAVRNCGIEDELYKFVVVCRYTERGNMKVKEIYKKGQACADCPQGTVCDATSGLCFKE